MTELELLEQIMNILYWMNETVYGMGSDISPLRNIVEETMNGMLHEVRKLVFGVAVISISVGFLWGMFTWRLIVLFKNQRSFW